MNIKFFLVLGDLAKIDTIFFGLDKKNKTKQNKTFKTKRICKCNHYLTLKCTIELTSNLACVKKASFNFFGFSLNITQKDFHRSFVRPSRSGDPPGF